MRPRMCSTQSSPENVNCNGTIPTTLILVAIFYLGGELWDAIFANDNVSQLTHIIGGICGTILGFALSGKKRK